MSDQLLVVAVILGSFFGAMFGAGLATAILLEWHWVAPEEETEPLDGDLDEAVERLVQDLADIGEAVDRMFAEPEQATDDREVV